MEDRIFRILVVDDDGDILELLKYNFEKEGFKVKTLANSQNTIKVARAFEPDLIILDIMMPHPNGIELCRSLRSMNRFQNTYIFFLSAKSERYYMQAALNTGGDDYIEKITGLRALTYKVNSVLRKRFIIRKWVPELKAGNMIISRKTNSVNINHRNIMLSEPEFELLFFFAQNPNKMITIENIICNIWGSAIYLADTSVETYLANLQRKIGLGVIQRTQPDLYRFIPPHQSHRSPGL